MKFYPYNKNGRGAEKVLAMLKGGHTSFEVPVVLTRELEVLAILIWGHKECPSFRRGEGSLTLS